MALLGGFQIPFRRFGVVLGYALACLVQPTELDLGGCFTLLSKWSIFPNGGLVITSIIRRPSILKISPRRSSAKQKRSNDGECGSYAAHG